MSEALDVLSNESLLRYVEDTAWERTLLEMTLAKRLHCEIEKKNRYLKVLFEKEVGDGKKRNDMLLAPLRTRYKNANS